jgi:hypothetical protein
LGIRVNYFVHKLNSHFYEIIFRVFIAVLVAWITLATIYEHFQKDYNVTGIFKSPKYVRGKMQKNVLLHDI